MDYIKGKWRFKVDGKNIEADFIGKRGAATSAWIEWAGNAPYVNIPISGRCPNYVYNELIDTAMKSVS